jgi:hypothetical protein
MPRPSHTPWFYHNNNNNNNNNNCEEDVIQCSTASRHFLLSTPFRNTVCSSISMRDQISHPYKKTGKIVVLCIIIKFLESIQKIKKKKSIKLSQHVICF